MTFNDLYYLRGEEKIFFVRVRVAGGILERARGLLFRAKLSKDQGLWIPGCNSIHTCFMAYSIDVVYLDCKNVITKIVSNLEPWQFSAALGAASVVELPAGCAEEKSLMVGAKIYFGRDNL